MNTSFKNGFRKSLDTGFIDQTTESELLYRPKLLINKHIPREKVLSTLIQELSYCQEFYISVAFVTTGGIATLINTLLELEVKGIKGKVVVSQYLNFTQPEALKRLLHFKNIELRISVKNNSHSKGYIFKTATYYNIIVGSSNWTATALTTNKEWNLKVSGLHDSEIVKNVILEFDSDFKEATRVTESYIADYELLYNSSRLSNVENLKTNVEEAITPNTMQLEALENLENLRSENKTKALIISATGTGKTYLSAFDVKAFQPKRILFVVHRLNIAKKALITFKKVFGSSKSFGVYSGNSKDLKADFIFSTVQTISRVDHLNQFEKDHFDYIIIDESHRSGANSYLTLIKYFEPRFLLGMTATPERTDGNDIFSLFDHNIAYEIRLNRAMEEGMLSQFHYYGITDLQVNNSFIENTKDFNLLGTEERAQKIIQKARRYGTDNGITRGLVFCSRNDEARLLSQKFNANGLKAIALSGDSSELERSEAINKLEADDLNEKIDYIFTVDIFNEGIDIPKINQILMIRPTESAIVFVQQLGRGLRKVNGKDYLTIIDFIGNHKNNYMIPIALYGDTSYNKDTLRKLISEGSKMLSGSSTINFDKITKEKIFQSIDSANMKILSDLKKEYNLLKYRLGRIPMMMDFLTNESRDPYLFVEYSKSYYNFVIKADNDFTNLIGKPLVNLLEVFSREINNSKRIEESYILKEIILNGEVKIKKLQDSIKLGYDYNVTDEIIKSCVNNLNFNFIRKPENIVIKKEDKIVVHKEFAKSLQHDTFRKFLLDSTDYSMNSFIKNYKKDFYRDGLILFNKYSRKDVCRLLNWDIDISSTIYGYRTKENITPCFVTYNKSQEIDDSINYNDHFLSPSIFAWESRSNRKLSSNEIQNVISSKRILLFVKKGDGEGTDFYFMGDCSIIADSIQQALMPKSQTPIVHFKFKLGQPVSNDLYSYITLKDDKEKDLDKPIILKDNKPIQLYTIPLYDFYAAAGDFSDIQSEKSYSQIEVPEKYSLDDDYFACRIIGESMNKRIPNGSVCIFKKYSGGSRSGKIFLIENHDIQDPDFNSAFTVKTYSSRKNVTDEGWEHTEILLKPNSYDPSYKDIVINEENSADMKVLGEFVMVLE
jgi:superfamily II DNA or RNA helicase